MTEPLQAVEPTMPVAAIMGGKRCLAARIIARIEAIPHRCYAEPFVGMDSPCRIKRKPSS